MRDSDVRGAPLREVREVRMVARVDRAERPTTVGRDQPGPRTDSTMRSFDDLFAGQRVMAILRGLPVDETLAIAAELWDDGITALEVPIGRPEQVATLEAAARAGAERGLAVGAGTVITREQVDAAVRAGAAYTVAPGLDLDVRAASEAAGLPHLPGIATGTELQRAHVAGFRWVKCFPAVALGAAWFDAIRGPFPDTQLVATGGVTVELAPDLLSAGARVVGLGATLGDPEQRRRLRSGLRVSERAAAALAG